MKRLLPLSFALGLLLLTSPSRADIANFNLSGKIYTKWLWRNNASQGVQTYGNPFWPENFSGDNGVGTEFEMTITGSVSKYVKAGIRLKSRFGALWHDFWENGNMRSGNPNTSGESLGMDHAEYFKLRGYWMRMALPIPSVRWVHVGSSNLGMFNAWTIGKVRYIDRDNAKGIFIEGKIGNDIMSYDLGIVALPKLWVGPWWSTGIGDPNVINPFYGQDYAYGLKLNIGALEWIRFLITATATIDLEADIYDPDAVGSKNTNANAPRDHAVGLASRYTNAVFTMEIPIEPETEIKVLKDMTFNLFGAASISRMNKNYVANGVAQNGGVFPMIYGDANSYAARARINMDDPAGIGLSFKFEYFNIGSNWTSIFAARREADVLLTDGFLSGGQLPTLNLANEFIDFNDAWYESCIGWHGATALITFDKGRLRMGFEYTALTYNTNSQGRDVDNTYPDFLHTDGFTDTDLYSYSNPPTVDRGRDPRSVYRRNQDRFTHIVVFKGSYTFNVGNGLKLGWKYKFIRDSDGRDMMRNDDNYMGYMHKGKVSLGYRFTDNLKVELGYKLDFWNEDNRSGSPTGGYKKYETRKHKGYVSLSYNFGGAKAKYYIEYLNKRVFLDDASAPDKDHKWSVWRSKAVLEVAW